MDRIQTALFGQTADGQRVNLYTLTNVNGVEVKIASYGGIVTSIRTPDQHGVFDDIVLGYDTLAEYEACHWYFGCITGRFANRIANSRFELDGVVYHLDSNLGQHHLHSAGAGFNKVVWQGATSSGEASARLDLTYVSADGHGGYPGCLSVTVSYTLNDTNELCIDYSAVTDKPTVVNLTNHSYFNLRGHQYASRDGVLDHIVKLQAASYIPTDNEGIPYGFFTDVCDTPMDFRLEHRIGDRIEDDYSQLHEGHGYDHTWMLDPGRLPAALVAEVTEPTTGRVLRVTTTQPGLQFYTANHMTDSIGKSKALYQKRGSLCLETQHPGDSPNQAGFPTTVLRPGQDWSQSTTYQFEINRIG